MQNNWQRYAAGLIYTANALLIPLLLLTRTARISGSSVPYFTVEFILLLVSAILLTGLFIVLLSGGRLGQWLAAASFVSIFAWVIGSFALLAAGIVFLTAFQQYTLPFGLWLALINFGFLVYALGSTQTKPLEGVLRYVLLVLAVVLPLLVLEGGLRLWFTFWGTEYERALYMYTAEEIAAKGRLSGLPYINFGLNPTYESHNSLGYRGAEVAVPKPDGVFRIVAMGGSTTYGISLNARETYPAQLEKILREDYGYSHVEVVNAGVVAYTSWESLVNFQFRIIDLQPDLLLVYDGINDVVARLVDPQFYNGINPARGIWRVNPTPLSSSVLHRFIAINLHLMENPTTLTTQLATQSPVIRCDGRDFCPALNMTPQEVLDANPPVYFERNLRHLAVLARFNGVKVLFSSWAYFPESMGEGIDPFMTYPHVQSAVAQQNDLLQAIATDEEALFYDLMAHMPYDKTYWFDGLHMTASGAHEQARLYADFLAENGLISPLAR